MMPRDAFPRAVKENLAKRVGYCCSNPDCGTLTTGPHTDSARHANLGVASHITAAAPGGPRFNLALTPQKRSSIGNAIWLCQSCAKLVDSDIPKYTIAVLADWKAQAEAKAMRALAGIPESEFFPQPASAKHAPIPRIGGLIYDEARERLMNAGWQPHMNHWTHANNFDMQYGNGLHFWRRGYHKIRHASGTGLGFCSFGFEDVYGHKLVVVTAGEIIEDINGTAHVRRWYFETDEGNV
jgi:hypothetical protein